MTEQAIRRHRNGHLPALLARGRDAEEIAWADGLLDQLRDLQRQTLGILSVAKAAGDVRTALVAVAVARDNLALLLKMWSAPGRPAWWTGEARWTPPPNPAAATKALMDRLRAATVDLTEDEKATLRRIVTARHERYMAARGAEAEAAMRSHLPSTSSSGNGGGAL